MYRGIIAMLGLFPTVAVAQEDTPKFQDFDGTSLQEITLLVQKMTGVRLLWTDEVVLPNKRVHFRSPKAIESGEEVLRIYESFLEVHDLMLVPVRVSGDAVPTYKVRPSQRMAKSAVVLEIAAKSNDRVVTRVFELRHVNPRDVHQALISMVTYPQAIFPIESAGILLITDYGFNLQRLEKIIAQMDRPRASQEAAVIPLTHRDAAELEPVLSALVAPAAKADPKPGFPTPNAPEPTRVVADRGSNSLVILADAAHLEMLKAVIQRLDVEKKK